MLVLATLEENLRANHMPLLTMKLSEPSIFKLFGEDVDRALEVLGEAIGVGAAIPLSLNGYFFFSYSYLETAVKSLKLGQGLHVQMQKPCVRFHCC